MWVTILWFASSPNPKIFIIRMFNTLVDFTSKELFCIEIKTKKTRNACILTIAIQAAMRNKERLKRNPVFRRMLLHSSP